jgi:hypothetical protein
MSRTICYGFASGHIGFTSDQVPNGALTIVTGPDQIVRETIAGLARRAYDNETLLVPGVPEAQDRDAAFRAFLAFSERATLQLQRAQAVRP